MSTWSRAGEQRSETSWPNLRIGSVVVGLVVLLGIGWVLGRATAPETLRVKTVPLPPGAARTEAGVPVGYAHSQAGAVDAATAYAVTLNGPLSLQPDDLKAAEKVMATVEYGPTLADQSGKAIQAMNSAYGVQSNTAAGAKPAVKLVPIAYQVESYDSGGARVNIWAVWLIAEEGILPPQQNWITVQMSLTWASKDWKLSGSGMHPGPVPQPPQGAVAEQSQPLAAPLTSDYTEYKHEGS